jgi:S-DNA-T family DNA segregation ATPase FtsK/SpoIIIE
VRPYFEKLRARFRSAAAGNLPFVTLERNQSRFADRQAERGMTDPAKVRKEAMYAHLFKPTENPRFNELIGFLGITLATLAGLSLLSYNPYDPSLNVAAPAAEGRAARNWIGPVGAYASDALFQVLGYPALLLPVGVLVLGWRWFRSREIPFPVAKLCGFALLVLAVASLLALMGIPEVRGAMPPGGMAGALLADALLAAFNPVGAHLVAGAAFLVALFLTTKFSFAASTEFLKGHLAIPESLKAQWKSWREAREKKAMLKKVEQNRSEGRPPIAPQVLGGAAAAPLASAVVAEAGAREKPSKLGPILVKMKESFTSRRDPEPEEEKPGKSKSAGPKIAVGKTAYRLPSPGLLRLPERPLKIREDELKELARAIEEKCREFDVQGNVTQINPGPVVTTYEFKPEAGIKVSRITGLADDLCLALKAESILIERIPGKSTIGIEVPNFNRETIFLREVVESPEFGNSTSKLTNALGKDIHGRIRVSDLASMPHLLIAGSTGAGKSVLINSLVISMLYKATPDELKLVLVDPKRLELGLYEDIPHLFTPVVTDPRVAANVLRNATREMESRLKLLAQRGVRNIDQYNRTFQKGQSLELFADLEEGEHKPLPYIVIIIDELADLMMVDTNGVEESITRLAQMARAVGIHLILATQRPSVDVITGLIKANFPSRIAFRVASKVDSRTILDANGAQSLLGRGDMLYLPTGSSRLHRIHGPMICEDEVQAVCEFWRAQARAKYNEELLKPPPKEEEEVEREAGAGGEIGADDVDDDQYQEAVRVVLEMGRASTSALQRRLRIGYGRAARLLDIMEKDGIIGPPDGPRPREVLKKPDWMHEFDNRMKV